MIRISAVCRAKELAINRLTTCGVRRDGILRVGSVVALTGESIHDVRSMKLDNTCQQICHRSMRNFWLSFCRHRSEVKLTLE